ncbi:MAG: radical SAM protein [Chloroflexi bacterium]|nr:radical SAM protein [Chloroflexota bacterium]
MWKNRTRNELDAGEVIDVLGQARDLGVKRVRFTGGEPLLRKDIGQLASAARRLGYERVGIQTNGLLLEKKAMVLAECGLTNLSVSVDGIEQTNDEIRGIDGYFRKAVGGIQLLKRLNPSIQIAITSTLSKQTLDQIPELLAECRRLDIQWDYNIMDNRLYFLRGPDLAPLLPGPEDAEKFRQHVNPRDRTVRVDQHSFDYAVAVMAGEHLSKEPPCVLGHLMIYVGSRGDIYSGCWVLSPLGSIRQTSLKQIIRSREYVQRVREMYRLQCPGCLCGYSMRVQVQHLPSTAIRELGLAPGKAPRYSPPKKVMKPVPSA